MLSYLAPTKSLICIFNTDKNNGNFLNRLARHNEPKIWRKLSSVISILILGANMSACATSTFSWKEEVLLHDGKKIIVERSDTYDSSMRHEIGQGAPLAEHKTTFKIPGTNQTVVWRSDNRSLVDPDDFHLLALDFLDGVPYVATITFGQAAFTKWGRPNPPYVFFKYYGKAWNRISLEEFPEKFKINITLPLDEADKDKVAIENREYGFVRAPIVAEISSKPGRSKESYSIIRTPIDYGPPRPEYKGPKAPFPITPQTTSDGKAN